MSEKKLDTQQNQNQSRNPQSELSHASPCPNYDWTESDDDTACNAYIVQEITVIGDKPSKVCEIVTDTVNERILLIDKRDKLNKLIESFTHPLSDTLLSMVKSDESINFEDSTKVPTKVEVEKAKPTAKPVSKATSKTKIEQKLDTAPVSKLDTTKPEMKPLEVSSSKPEAEAKVEQKPKKEAPVQAVKGGKVKNETKDVPSVQTFLPDLSKIQEKFKEAPVKADESKMKVEAKPLNIVKKSDIMSELPKSDINSKPKQDVKEIATKSEPKLEREKPKSDEKSKEAVTKAFPVPATPKNDSTSTSVKTNKVESKLEEKNPDVKVELISKEPPKNASLKSASETDISKSKEQKRLKDKMKKKSNDQPKAIELTKTEDKSDAVPPKSDDIKPKDEQKPKDIAPEIPILHNLPKMNVKTKTDESKPKVEKQIETVKSTTKTDAVKREAEKQESGKKTKDIKPTSKGDDKKPKIDENPKEAVATMVALPMIPKSDDKIKGTPDKPIDIKPMPEDRKLIITDTSENKLDEKQKTVPIPAAKADVIKQKIEENLKDIVPKSENKADVKTEKGASNILSKSEFPKSEPPISFLPGLPKFSGIATKPATKLEKTETTEVKEKPKIDDKKDKTDAESTVWSVGVPEFWPSDHKAKTATSTPKVVQPKAEEKPKETMAKPPDTG